MSLILPVSLRIKWKDIGWYVYCVHSFVAFANVKLQFNGVCLPSIYYLHEVYPLLYLLLLAH